MKAPSISEAALHKQVFDYLSWALPENAFAFHCPNGGSRDVREARNLKKLGVRAGFPDIGVLCNSAAVFFELKSEKGSLSAAQKQCIPLIERAGCPVYVCRSLNEVIVGLKEQDIPLRAEPISTERIRRGFQKTMNGAAP